MKNLREYFLACLEAEGPKFVRVLKAIPVDQTAYRPHPRSSCAGDIAWLLAGELGDACALVEKGSVEFAMHPAPAMTEVIAVYERNLADLQKRVAALEDAKWDTPAAFKVDGNVVWEAPLGDMLFGFLFDAIHHRGQLSSYLRPMGGKVPSIYGPSADEPNG
jgi:hypothetical protein